MISVLPGMTDGIRQFHADPWPFQQTFKTPLKDLSRFVFVLLSPFQMEKGILSTDEVVFKPEHLLQLMASNSIIVENFWDLNLEVEGHEGIAELLEAALSDWVDFVFLPSIESFAIYADHDEFTTLYFKEQTVLTNLTFELVNAGFEPVKDYSRSHQ